MGTWLGFSAYGVVKVNEVISERDDFDRCYGQTPTLKVLSNEFAGKTDDDKLALVDYVAMLSLFFQEDLVNYVSDLEAIETVDIYRENTALTALCA